MEEVTVWAKLAVLLGLAAIGLVRFDAEQSSAYALSRFVFPARRVYLVATLAAQLISPIVLVVPLYRLFVDLALLNSYASLVAVYAAVQLPFTTWFLKGYLDTVPRELDEAALVDGCGRLRAMAQAVLPAAAPGIA